MTFTCSFRGPTERLSRQGFIVSDPESAESEMVAISRGCEMLAGTDAKFMIGGFGESSWKLDVWYDLSVFLEQVSDALRELSQGNDCEIEIYSQGVERTLAFHPGGDEVAIECISSTDWAPDPEMERIGLKELLSMLENLAAEYSRSVLEIDKDAALIKPFSDWTQGIFWQGDTA